MHSSARRRDYVMLYTNWRHCDTQYWRIIKYSKFYAARSRRTQSNGILTNANLEEKHKDMFKF
jgi:hypothetical protein